MKLESLVDRTAGREVRDFHIGINVSPGYLPIGYHFRSGWPLKSLYGEAAIARDDKSANGRWSFEKFGFEYRYLYLINEGAPNSPYILPMFPVAAVALPLLPILPGFAINTLFYAVMLWMLSAGLFALRRMIRRRPGRCPACAYPIGQSPVCTECGAEVVT